MTATNTAKVVILLRITKQNNNYFTTKCKKATDASSASGTH